MSYMVDKPPNADPILQRKVRPWEPKEHRPVLAFTRSAYKPFNTYVAPSSSLPNLSACTDIVTYCSTKNKYNPWVPVAAPRQ